MLDRARLHTVVDGLTDRLDGDWLLLGGALVALWLEPRRVTEDIDVMPMAEARGARLALMRAAVDLGLSVETVNSAAEYFVHRIPDWRDHVEPFRTGTRARFFRPDPTLFVLLTLERMTDQDLADCMAVLDRPDLVVDKPRLIRELGLLPPTGSGADARRAALEQRLSS